MNRIWQDNVSNNLMLSILEYLPNALIIYIFAYRIAGGRSKNPKNQHGTDRH